MKASLTALLHEQSTKQIELAKQQEARQAQLEKEIREALARIETELSRLERMEKHSDAIRRNVDGISDEIRKAQKALNGLLGAGCMERRSHRGPVSALSDARGAPVGGPGRSLIAGSNEPMHRHAQRRLARRNSLCDRVRTFASAEYNFATWFDSASEFWRLSRYASARSLNKHSAFLLHQATERYYHAAHLVFTGYKQQTHDIEKLGTMAGEQHPLLVEALPKTEPEDKRLFDLLKKAYIEARYSGSYRITQEELTTLQARVITLAERVRTACIEKLGSFCGADRVRADLPTPPQLSEPPLSNLPAPPEDPRDFAQWAQSLAELSEQRGRIEGRREGELLGEAKALLLVLRSRGLHVPAALEQRILACADPAVLAAWLQRAVVITSAEDLLVG